MTSSDPTMTYMKALVIEESSEGLRAVVKQHPIPSICDDEVLVKVVAAAQNPTDWKHVAHVGVGRPGSVLGCDFSGTVCRVGKDVTSPKIGDRVSGFVHGGLWADEGTYAEYLRAAADLVWVVPENTLSHEEAATVSCCLWTVAQAYYHPTRMGLRELPDKAANEDEWFFVYGGSTAVGQFAIQLARLSGYRVVTTCSPRNFELVKALGAEAVFDYHDPDVVMQIKNATEDTLTKAIDTISLEDSQRLTAEAMGPHGGKAIILMKARPDWAWKGREGVIMQHTLLYTALGRAFEYPPNVKFPISLEDRAHLAAFVKITPQLVKERKVTPPKIKLWEGGLAAIPEALEYMREDKVSGEKIVHVI